MITEFKPGDLVEVSAHAVGFYMYMCDYTLDHELEVVYKGDVLLYLGIDRYVLYNSTPTFYKFLYDGKILYQRGSNLSYNFLRKI